MRSYYHVEPLDAAGEGVRRCQQWQRWGATRPLGHAAQGDPWAGHLARLAPDGRDRWCVALEWEGEVEITRGHRPTSCPDWEGNLSVIRHPGAGAQESRVYNRRRGWMLGPNRVYTMRLYT